MPLANSSLARRKVRPPTTALKQASNQFNLWTQSNPTPSNLTINCPDTGPVAIVQSLAFWSFFAPLYAFHATALALAPAWPGSGTNSNYDNLFTPARTHTHWLLPLERTRLDRTGTWTALTNNNNHTRWPSQNCHTICPSASAWCQNATWNTACTCTTQSPLYDCHEKLLLPRKKYYLHWHATQSNNDWYNYIVVIDVLVVLVLVLVQTELIWNPKMEWNWAGFRYAITLFHCHHHELTLEWLWLQKLYASCVRHYGPWLVIGRPQTAMDWQICPNDTRGPCRNYWTTISTNCTSPLIGLVYSTNSLQPFIEIVENHKQQQQRRRQRC